MDENQTTNNSHHPATVAVTYVAALALIGVAGLKAGRWIGRKFEKSEES